MRTWNPLRALSSATRNAPWVVMAVAIHAIGLAVLSVWYVAQEKKPAEEWAITLNPVRRAEEVLPIEVPAPQEPKRHAVPENVAAELVKLDEAYVPQFADETLAEIPDPGDPSSEVELPTGDSTGGTAIGVGPRGRHGTGKPSAIFGDRPGDPGRGDLGRPPRLGPNQELHELVLGGLRWLARHQNPDGSWSARELRSRCDAAQPCADPNADFHALYDEGTTALAVLTFLGAGFSHESKQFLVDPVRGKRHRIGEIVKSGLQWLVKRQDADGRFSKDQAFLYNEALATMALTEAYGLTRSNYWKGPAQRGVDYLQRAQRPSPSGTGLWGWRYLPRSEVEDPRTTGTGAGPSKELFDADTSVTTWCVMALKSAELAELAIEPRSMQGAFDFVAWVTAADGRVGYIDPKGAGATVTGKNDHYRYHPAVMSALGMCTRAFVRHDPSDPVLELSAKQLVQDLPAVSKDGLSVDYYYWYYGSLALNQFDGPESPRKSSKYWGPWNKAMVDSLKALVDPTPDRCRAGGWIVPDRWSYASGPVYSTALAVLTLEVYYRYANAFAGVRRAR